MSRPRAWQLAVFALVVVRLGMWWLFQHDLPRMQIHDGWKFYHGGDQAQYFLIAKEIVAGHPRPHTASAGWSFVLAGLIRFVGSHDYTDLLPEIVIGNGVWLALVSVPAMAQFGLALSGSRLQALCAAAVWTLLPYLLWLGFGLHPDAENLRNSYVSRQMWVSGITDGSSLLFTVLGAALALRRARSWLWLGLAGLSLGWAAALRIQVFPVALVVIAALLWARRWPGAAVLLLGCVIGFAPQLWYDTASTGHPLNLPYFVEWVRFTKKGTFIWQWNNMPANPASLVGNLSAWIRRLPALVAAAAVGAGAGLAACVRLWRRDNAAALVMFGAPLASFALHVVTYIYGSDPLRYTLPAVSFGLPALVWTAFCVGDWSYPRAFRREKKGNPIQ